MILVCGLLVGSFSATTIANSDIKSGMVFENLIHLKETNTQIALPPGKWEVGSAEERGNSVGEYSLAVNLFQEVNGTLSKVVFFITPLEYSPRGFVESKYCLRDNMHYRETISSANGGDQECRWINHETLTLKGSRSKLNRMLGEHLETKNIKVPIHAIHSGYRFADTQRFLDLQYYVFPLNDGFPDYERTSWSGSPWHPQSISDDPKKRAYIERLKLWTKEWHERARAGFDNKLIDAPQIMPTKPTVIDQPTSEPSSAADRLKQLGTLFKQGLISKDEYERKRKEILKGL